jgi:adenylate cyclase
MRRSTALFEKRPPFDTLFILNHFFEAVGSAVAQSGGRPNQFIGDGSVAIFGTEVGPVQACRQALAAARLVERRVAEMNLTLAEELAEPIRMGIRLHAGTVILGEVGYHDNIGLTAIGDTVNVAARPESMTKEFACQTILSELVGTTAGADLSGFPSHAISVRGRDAGMSVRAIVDAGLLDVPDSVAI